MRKIRQDIRCWLSQVFRWIRLWNPVTAQQGPDLRFSNAVKTFRMITLAVLESQHGKPVTMLPFPEAPLKETPWDDLNCQTYKSHLLPSLFRWRKATTERILLWNKELEAVANGNSISEIRPICFFSPLTRRFPPGHGCNYCSGLSIFVPPKTVAGTLCCALRLTTQSHSTWRVVKGVTMNTDFLLPFVTCHLTHCSTIFIEKGMIFLTIREFKKSGK